MGCLSDLIGAAYCGASTGVIDIAQVGISREEIGSYAGAEHASEWDFLTERMAMAERVVINDVLGHHLDRVIQRTYIDRGRLGNFDDLSAPVQKVPGNDTGMVLRVSSRGSNLILDINRIDVWTPQATAFNVRFYDLADGRLLHTESITPTADTITSKATRIAIAIPRREMRILVVSDLADFYRSTPGLTGCDGCRMDGTMIEVSGARIPTASTPYRRANVVRTSNTGGLSLTATLRCDHAAWLCEMGELMALPMALKTAEEVMAYGINNHARFNAFKGQNTDELKERAAHFATKYSEAIDKLLKSMPPPTDEHCFKCSRVIRQTIAIP